MSIKNELNKMSKNIVDNTNSFINIFNFESMSGALKKVQDDFSSKLSDYSKELDEIIKKESADTTRPEEQDAEEQEMEFKNAKTGAPVVKSKQTEDKEQESAPFVEMKKEEDKDKEQNVEPESVEKCETVVESKPVEIVSTVQPDSPLSGKEIKTVDLDLSAAVKNALIEAGLDTVKKIKETSDVELLKIKGLGKKALEKLKAIIDK